MRLVTLVIGQDGNEGDGRDGWNYRISHQEYQSARGRYQGFVSDSYFLELMKWITIIFVTCSPLGAHEMVHQGGTAAAT